MVFSLSGSKQPEKLLVYYTQPLVLGCWTRWDQVFSCVSLYRKRYSSMMRKIIEIEQDCITPYIECFLNDFWTLSWRLLFKARHFSIHCIFKKSSLGLEKWINPDGWAFTENQVSSAQRHFLILMPLMPNLPFAIIMLLRFSISQMDVSTRQSYTMAVVTADERSATSGVT